MDFKHPWYVKYRKEVKILFKQTILLNEFKRCSITGKEIFTIQIVYIMNQILKDGCFIGALGSF